MEMFLRPAYYATLQLNLNLKGGEAVQNRDPAGSPGDPRTKEATAVEAGRGHVHWVIKY
jgi:hypothetical protein